MTIAQRGDEETDAARAMASLAASVFRERSDPEYVREIAGWSGILGTADPILRSFHSQGIVLADRHPGLKRATELIFSSEPDLSPLMSQEGQLDPLVLTAAGGSRASPVALVVGLLASAFLQMNALRLPNEESTFVELALANFDELRSAARGERVAVLLVFGIGGVKIDEGREINTPWGVVRPAAQRPLRPGFHPVTNAFLVQSRRASVRFSRQESPEERFEPSELSADDVFHLLPLACCLASGLNGEPIAPVITWSTVLLPFQGTSGYGLPFLSSRWKWEQDITPHIPVVEEWSRCVEASHAAGVDVAARRLVSAVAHRNDRGDALIDAVIAWENIFGTSSETTFRVTSALAKMLEPDKSQRRGLRRELSRLYGMRSRVVHGAHVDPGVINAAADTAVKIAVRALALSYHRGREWLSLSSETRAEVILLEEP